MKNQEALNLLKEYEQNYSLEFADISVINVNHDIVKDLISENKYGEFELIGIHGSGSLLCIWKSRKAKDKSSLDPVVWLDSEGDPNSVISHSVVELLSLIPWGFGLVYDIVTEWEFYDNSQSQRRSPLLTFTKEKLAQYEIIDSFLLDGKVNYVNWLAEDIGMLPCVDPVRVIGKARADFQNLNEWLVGS